MHFNRRLFEHGFWWHLNVMVAFRKKSSQVQWLVKKCDRIVQLADLLLSQNAPIRTSIIYKKVELWNGNLSTLLMLCLTVNSGYFNGNNKHVPFYFPSRIFTGCYGSWSQSTTDLIHPYDFLYIVYYLLPTLLSNP